MNNCACELPEESMQHDGTSHDLHLRRQAPDRLLDHGSRAALEKDLCIHIFGVSAGMVGVCVTVIGLLRVAFTLDKVNTLADDLLAGDALLFLLACIASYWALRTRSTQRMHQVENVADLLFLVGLAGMVGVCLLLTYTLVKV
jgi:hypothetical protein